MKNILTLSIFLSLCCGISEESQARSFKLMRNSTAVILPGRLMKPAGKDGVSEYDDRVQEQTEGQTRTIQQYLHGVDLNTVNSMTNEELYFGHRRNVNQKKVKIVVDLSRQVAIFSSPDVPHRLIRVATGDSAHSTARFIGCYNVKFLNKNHESKEYNGAPMPNATFFIETRGIATHTGDIGGRSHGCVRMQDHDSEFVMNQVAKHSRKVFDIMKNRQRTVYDAEVCIVPSIPKAKIATKRRRG